MSYWDSRGAAEELFADRKTLVRLGLPDESAGEYFAGDWHYRNRLNVPGPFYGAETDTCCCGPLAAPGNVLIDETGQEFVWRQPRNVDELCALLDAAWQDPFCGYAWDGDEYWTVERVRYWWRDRAEVSEWIDDQLRDKRLLRSKYDYEQAAITSLRQFRTYFDGALGSDLREYLFWLEDRPHNEEPLPQLSP